MKKFLGLLVGFFLVFAVYGTASATMYGSYWLTEDDGSFSATHRIGDNGGDYDVYQFNLGFDVVNGNGSFLDIFTSRADGERRMDTEIGLYQWDGNGGGSSDFDYIDDDDDSGANYFSQLTFPADGELDAGWYRLVVGSWNTIWNTNNYQNSTFGDSRGWYDLTVNSDAGSSPVPEPATMLLFGLGLLGLAGVSRKKK